MADLESKIEILRNVAPDASDEQIIAALKRHPNDLNAAVMAILDQTVSDAPFIGPIEQWPAEDEQITRGRGVLNSSNPSRNRNNSPNQSQIDLTRLPDDSVLAGTVFSHVDSHTNEKDWAMVPVSGPAVQATAQDDDLSRAMEASLQQSYQSEAESYHEAPLEERIRDPTDIPVALRCRASNQVLISTLIHSTFHIPQLLAIMRQINARDPRYFDTETLVPFFECFARMELQQQRYFPIEDVIPNPPQPGSMSEHKSTAELIYQQFANEMTALHPTYTARLAVSRIWSSIGAQMSSSASELAGSPDSPNKAIIPINSDVNDPQNDLLSHLHQMTWTRKLEYAGQVLCFAINRETDFIGPVTREASGSGGPATKYPLKFPSRLFVDPFLLDNQEAASLQRKLRSFMSSKVVEMEKNNSLLTKYNNKDTLRNLKASIKYFEEIVSDGGDVEQQKAREHALLAMKASLIEIEKQIESNIQGIKETRVEMTQVYDVPTLQQHPYDLRAVIMWDGVWGRSHIYDYVRGYNGKWYKTVDSEVTEVSEETVLTDTSGLHLGAGPFMLFYSEEIDPKFDAPPDVTHFRQWHPAVRDTIRRSNLEFYEQFSDDIKNQLLLSDPLELYSDQWAREDEEARRAAEAEAEAAITAEAAIEEEFIFEDDGDIGDPDSEMTALFAKTVPNSSSQVTTASSETTQEDSSEPIEDAKILEIPK